MELGLTHRALEAQQQPVVEVTGIVDAVLVEDERVGERADLEEPMPVGGAPREPRDFQAHGETDPPEADLSHQPLEAVARGGAGGREPLVLVDYDDLLGAPAEGIRPALEVVLARGALAMLDHLAGRPQPRTCAILPCVRSQFCC